MEVYVLIVIIKILFIYLPILFFFKIKTLFVMSLAFVLFHESVHLLAGIILKFRILKINILPFGAMLSIKDIDIADPIEDFIISIAGPCSNILLCCIFTIMFYYNHEILFYNMALCNWIIGFLNIIPAYPLDGGRIFRALINCKYIYKKANDIVLNFSIITGLILTVIYLVCFFKGYISLSLSIGIIAWFILFGAMEEKERIRYLVMSDLLKKRTRFKQRGYMETRVISIYYKKSILSSLSLMDKSKYNIFYVIDDNFCVLDIVFEGDIIEILKESGDVTFEEYVDL